MEKLLLVFFLFFSISCFSQEKLLASCCEGKEEGRCTGSSYCTACYNCSRCKHCSAGGSCGVCESRTTPVKRTSFKSNSSGSSRSTGSGSDSGSSDTYTKDSYLRVTSETLNLREGPGTNYKVVQELKKGDLVQYLSSHNDWLIVKVYSTGKVGYVSAKYVE